MQSASQSPAPVLRLSRVGAEVSARFARALAPLGVTPPEVSALRAVALAESSQRELAERLGIAPSRMVALLDSLEARGVVARIVDPLDRRRRVVRLTAEGRVLGGRLREVVHQHESEVLSALTDPEVDELERLLGKVEASLGMVDEGHPGMDGAEGARVSRETETMDG